MILLAGLQGAGKTTSAAKLGKWLKESERKKVLLASTDVYRPAAILQLERLAAQLDIGFYPSDPKKSGGRRWRAKRSTRRGARCSTCSSSTPQVACTSTTR